jgi:hypothetical protein|tara:strand:+ start:144 stop:473 length:330 start_codon:yes stop_codon:yes gene_type:complete
MSEFREPLSVRTPGGTVEVDTATPAELHMACMTLGVPPSHSAESMRQGLRRKLEQVKLARARERLVELARARERLESANEVLQLQLLAARHRASQPLWFHFFDWLTGRR